MIEQNFTIYTNEDWVASVGLQTDITLVGAVALMQVKPAPGHPDDWVDMSSETDANDEGITFTLNTTTKVVDWIVPQERVWEIPPGSYAYDILVIYASGRRRREASGIIGVNRGVTDAARANPVNVLDVGGPVLETE